MLTESEPNSVAIHGNLLAVAAANAIRTENGHAVFFEHVTMSGRAPASTAASEYDGYVEALRVNNGA